MSYQQLRLFPVHRSTILTAGLTSQSTTSVELNPSDICAGQPDGGEGKEGQPLANKMNSHKDHLIKPLMA